MPNPPDKVDNWEARNNNFGGIRRTDVPPAGPNNGGFRSYESPEVGVAAIVDLLQSYANKHKLYTLEGIISRWAPPHENPTAKLVQDASTLTGFKSNEKLNLQDPEILSAVTEAMIRNEFGGKLPVHPYTINSVVKDSMPVQTEKNFKTPPNAPDYFTNESGPFQNPGPNQPMSDPVQDFLQGKGAFTPPQQQAPATNFAPYPVSQPAGTQKYQEDSANTWAADQAMSHGFDNRLFQLNQARNALKVINEKDLETGKGSEALNNLRSFFLTMTPEWMKNIGITPDAVKTAKFDELKKYLTQYAQSRAAGIGPQTNQGLSTTLTGQPNMDVTSMGLRELLDSTIGVERMQHAKVLNFKDAKKDPNQYLDFGTEWATKANPNAYILDLVPPDKVKTILEGVPQDQRQQFFDQVQSAEKLGLVQPPQKQ